MWSPWQVHLDSYGEAPQRRLHLLAGDSETNLALGLVHYVFVHVSAVERAGLSTLNEGAKVSYEEKENRGKTSAENLRFG